MKIKSKEDYIKLLSCIEFEDKWKWVSVDEDGHVFAHTNKPEKVCGKWDAGYEHAIRYVMRLNPKIEGIDWQDSLVEINK